MELFFVLLPRAHLPGQVYGEGPRVIKATCRNVGEIGRVRIVTRQPLIRGNPPAEERYGLNSPHLASVSVRIGLVDFWYRETDNLLALDVKPGNLVRTRSGILSHAFNSDCEQQQP